MKKRVRRHKYQPGSFIPGRARLLFYILGLGFAALSLRAISIHLFPAKQSSLSQMANQQYRQTIALARYRGNIYDSQGEALALSIRKPSLFINPRVFKPNLGQKRELRRILKLNRRAYYRSINRTGYFSWLKRKVSRTAATKVMKMNIAGLHRVLEPARFYPNGSSAANLLGYVGIDDQGLAGIERRFNQQLSGKPIQLESRRDAKGHVIFNTAKAAAPEQRGDGIYLTIDRVIQEIAEQALREGVKEADAKGGMAIVSDPHTGRVLAVANNPSFNPNRWASFRNAHRKNYAFANAFEPGSVVKPILVAAALDAGKINLSKRYDCEQGRIKVGRHWVRDAHKPKEQHLSVADIVQHSSNVCMYKLAQDIGPEAVYRALQSFGLGNNRKSLNYPGEAGGILSPWQSWRPIRLANIAFGQGMMATASQVVQAYAAIANGGRLLDLNYLSKVVRADKILTTGSPAQAPRQAISPETAKKMRGVLGKIVEEGATKARSDLYTAGGKTGTTQKVDPETRSYSHTRHLSGFVGMAPIMEPHIIVYVQIDEPRQKLSYGSLWAAPVFRQIVDRTLQYLNVAPDRKDAKSMLVLSKKSHDTKRSQ